MSDCDVLVIGAGPAGSVAATLLARRGFHVYLVEKKAFPRRKVCGACLSGFAIEGLRKAQLTVVLDQTIPLSSFQLAAGGESALIPLHDGCVVSRAALDAKLVREAVAAGAVFFDETTAELGPPSGERTVRLTTRSSTEDVRAKSVIIAAGLRGASFRHDPAFRPTVAKRALIGAGAEYSNPQAVVQTGRIIMATHRFGYVGLVQTENGTTNIAAALNPRFVSSNGGVGKACQQIVTSAGFSPLVPDNLHWTGTPPLTRRPKRLASQRAFLIGDAAGYVEPFTGEGIGWAIASATEVVPFVAQAVAGWSDSLSAAWTKTHWATVGRRQRFCRAIAAGLRSSHSVGMAIQLLQRFPSAARPVLRHLAPT